MSLERGFKLTIAYDGTGFAGWQVQPGQPTIQLALQQALQNLTQNAVTVVGSGRTDAGVHALGQVASVKLDTWRGSASDLMRAVNSQLPDTIVVRQASEVPVDFHAIRDAIGKRYRYQLQVGGNRDAFEYRYRWHVHGAMDVDAIREAATRFVGKHDFASFQASGGDIKKTTVRHVRDCRVTMQPGHSDDGVHTDDTLHLDEGLHRDDGLRMAIEVEADGFLYNMVRNIVGTLIEVGRGKQKPSWIDDVLAARDRCVAGPTAPAHGLFLVRVDYESPSGDVLS